MMKKNTKHNSGFVILFAVTLAAETQLPVLASDINPQALAVAKHNAQQHHVKDTIEFQQGSLLDPLVRLFTALASSTKQIDSHTPTFSHLIICANLPYLTTSQHKLLDPDVQQFEPEEALVAGPDGLEAYWNLFRSLREQRALFPPSIHVFVEIDPSQTNRIQQLIAHEFPNAPVSIAQDLAGHDRLVHVDL